MSHDAFPSPPPQTTRSDREYFDELVEMDAAARIDALGRIGERDPAQRDRIARLLDAESATSHSRVFLDRAFLAAVGEVGAETSPFGPLPRPLGHFRLVRVLGTGGMGVVFEAEQQRPRRRVALKVMRADVTSQVAMQRFRREIETLGRLQHPGIAQIHEAGSLESRDGVGDALPYIAMELVEGEPLDEFVRHHQAHRRLIVEVMALVTDAVHHAHQRGVVHRDLKPANILVVSRAAEPPKPTILDFGIARLTEREGPAGTIATSAGQILGTLAYMSPEQLGGDPAAIDHRTDVYALGVILYELLAGRLPLDVRDRPIADAARIVRDEEPTRLGTIDHQLRGDLETIVSKAIEKDPTRRYPSALALGDELRRFLRDEPILARPTTRMERARRFARRNRAVVLGISATILALLCGTIATAIFATQAVRALDNAEWLAYRSNLSAASSAFAAHDMASARRFLDQAPQRFRGWEWRYIDANLDRSVGQIVLNSPLLPDELAMQPWSDVTVTLALAQIAPPAEWLPTTADLTPPSPDAYLLDVQRSSGRTLWRLTPETLLIRQAEGDVRIPLPRTDEEIERGFSAFTGRLSPAGDAIAVLVGTHLPSKVRAWYFRLDGSLSASTPTGNGGRHNTLVVGPDDLVGLNGSPETWPALWKPRENRLLHLRGNIGDVNTVAINSDGTRIATGGADRSVRLYSTNDAAVIATNRDHLDQVTCLAFSPDGRLLASGSFDHTVRVWETQALAPRMVLNGHRGALQGVEFGGPSWIVSYDDTKALRRWPSDAGAAVGDLLVEESNWGRVLFAQQRNLLFAMSNVWTIRRWDLDAGADRGEFPVEVIASRIERWHDSFVVSPSGSTAAVRSSGGVASLFTRMGETWTETRFDGVKADAIAFDDKERCIGLRLSEDASGGRELKPGDRIDHLVCTLPDQGPVGLPLPRLYGHQFVSSVDGRQIAFPAPKGDGHDVVVADAQTGIVRYRIPAGYGLGYCFGRLTDGRSVLAAVESIDTINRKNVLVITIRAAEDGALITRLHGHTGHVFALAFTPDGTRLASGGRDRLVRFWDTRTWQEITSFSGQTSFIWSLAFSSDGTYLASSGGDRTYRVWRTK